MREKSPTRWASDLSAMLKTVLGSERFPIDVKRVAIEYSKQLYPDDRITDVLGDSLPGFEGGLQKAQDGRSGWGIIYNRDIQSQGRINFTLAHELGHYLMHRIKYPSGHNCKNIYEYSVDHEKIERDADVFAKELLMPLDDYRQQISPSDNPTIEILGRCATRYNVSLTAAVLRCLEFTKGRAILVVSRDEFILWTRSSRPAFQSGLFIKTNNLPPVALPDNVKVAHRRCVVDNCGRFEWEAGVWLNEPCEEEVWISPNHDQTFSLLKFENAGPRCETQEEDVPDLSQQLEERTPGSPWLG